MAKVDVPCAFKTPSGNGFGDVSPYVCSYYFSLVSVAEWPPFGK